MGPQFFILPHELNIGRDVECLYGVLRKHHEVYLGQQKKLLPLSPHELSTNTHACVASIQVSSITNSEDVNMVVQHTIAPIKVK